MIVSYIDSVIDGIAFMNNDSLEYVLLMETD